MTIRTTPGCVSITTSFLLSLLLPSFVRGQFCKRLESNTWQGLVETIRSVEEDFGYAILCAFEISGDDCPSTNVDMGYQISEGRNLILVCDPDLFGYNPHRNECIVNCPGVHFTVSKAASLTLDGWTLAGATNSSIQVRETATLRMTDSIMRE